MDKLIELFRDYVENYWDDTKDPTKDYVVIYDWQWFYVGARFYSDEKVLSKNFLFIEWLVENDKIDFTNIPNKIKEIWIPITIQGEIRYWFDSSDYYWLLMLLSIQDNPIEFLCEILK